MPLARSSRLFITDSLSPQASAAHRPAQFLIIRPHFSVENSDYVSVSKMGKISNSEITINFQAVIGVENASTNVEIELPATCGDTASAAIFC